MIRRLGSSCRQRENSANDEFDDDDSFGLIYRLKLVDVCSVCFSFSFQNFVLNNNDMHTERRNGETQRQTTNYLKKMHNILSRDKINNTFNHLFNYIRVCASAWGEYFCLLFLLFLLLLLASICVVVSVMVRHSKTTTVFVYSVFISRRWEEDEKQQQKPLICIEGNKKAKCHAIRKIPKARKKLWQQMK